MMSVRAWMGSLEPRVKGWDERTVIRDWIDENRIPDGGNVPEFGATHYILEGGVDRDNSRETLRIFRVTN